jgi:hypothetical protein
MGGIIMIPRRFGSAIIELPETGNFNDPREPKEKKKRMEITARKTL